MVARPYLNLLVNLQFLSGFLEKKYNFMHFEREKNIILCILKGNIILCILKGNMPFKMHKIIFFSRKPNKKILCVPTLT